MKFSKCVLLAAFAPSAVGFAPLRPVQHRAPTNLFALEDLEAKLLGNEPAPEPKKKSKPAPAPKPVKAPPAPKPAPVVKPPAPPAAPDANAVPKGVALGAAPLVVAPVVALAAGRDFLSKTAARRQAIQEEIAAKEAALAAKKKAQADVDFGGLAGAAVSCFSGFVHPTSQYPIDVEFCSDGLLCVLPH